MRTGKDRKDGVEEEDEVKGSFGIKKKRKKEVVFFNSFGGEICEEGHIQVRTVRSF